MSMGVRLFPAVHGHIADSVRDPEPGWKVVVVAVELPLALGEVRASPTRLLGCATLHGADGLSFGMRWASGAVAGVANCQSAPAD